ncbi:MAG: thioredoxin [Candidatus Bathyarchaeia archaeon]
MSDQEIERIKAKKMEELKKSLSSNAKELKVYDFDEVKFNEFINKNKPVLIDFWAEWCAPCLIMKPILDELAEDYGERVIFGRVNVDENQNLAIKYGINAIPTFILFLNGKPVERLVGAVGKKPLEKIIRKVSQG